MTRAPASIRAVAVAVLETGPPADKLAASRAAVAAWRTGGVAPSVLPTPVTVPERPARPARPELLAPGAMPKRRRAGSRNSRIALLHALAHIEFNAIDLAWDLLARFAGDHGGAAFVDDWVSVAAEETLHFELLADRLASYDAAYGDLPAHDGLWEAALATGDDILARLAIVPLVLEARGLDVTPGMIGSLTKAGDVASAAVLDQIYQDEIGHVRTGKMWFDRICAARGLCPETCWADLVESRFKGQIKGPFNTAARRRAGLAPSFYDPGFAANAIN